MKFTDLVSGIWLTGTEYYVSKTGNDSNGGTNWADAKLTFSAGIALLTNPGDILYVAGGAGTGDSVGFAENISIPKGCVVLGVTGQAGTIAQVSHPRIIGDEADGSNPIVIIGEGAILMNVRIEAHITTHSSTYIRMYNGSKFLNSTFGGTLADHSQNVLEMIGGMWITVRNIIFGCTNINASKYCINIESPAIVEDCKFHDTNCSVININNSWARINNNNFGEIATGKYAVILQSGAGRCDVVDNNWNGDGVGDFVNDSSGNTNNLIQNNGGAGGSIFKDKIVRMMQNIERDSLGGMMFPLLDTAEEANGPRSQRFTAVAGNTSFPIGTEKSVIFTDLDKYETNTSKRGAELLGCMIIGKGSGRGAWQITGGYKVITLGASPVIDSDSKFGDCKEMKDADIFIEDTSITGYWTGSNPEGEQDRSEEGWTFTVRQVKYGVFPTSGENLEIRSINPLLTDSIWKTEMVNTDDWDKDSAAKQKADTYLKTARQGVTNDDKTDTGFVRRLKKDDGSADLKTWDILDKNGNTPTLPDGVPAQRD